jgi:hypothetical protein
MLKLISRYGFNELFLNQIQDEHLLMTTFGATGFSGCFMGVYVVQELRLLYLVSV